MSGRSAAEMASDRGGSRTGVSGVLLGKDEEGGLMALTSISLKSFPSARCDS